MVSRQHGERKSAIPTAVLFRVLLTRATLRRSRKMLYYICSLLDDSGRGPIRSTPMAVHTFSLMGMGWSSAVDLSHFLGVFLGWVERNRVINRELQHSLIRIRNLSYLPFGMYQIWNKLSSHLQPFLSLNKVHLTVYQCLSLPK